MTAATERHNRGGAGLGHLWHRWLAVVELIAHRGTARGGVDPDGYRALCRDLLAACRARAATEVGAGRELYEQMGQLVAPWVSVASLEQADPEILSQLLALGRQLGRQAGGRRRVGLGRGWAWFFGLALLAAGFTLVLQATCGALSPVLRGGVGQLLEARSLLLHSGYEPWLFVGAAVLTVLAIYVVSRTARR
jgi:hypothetical protein